MARIVGATENLAVVQALLDNQVGRGLDPAVCLPKGPEIMVPAFGYRNYIATDRRHGLIRKWTVTHAAANDRRQLAGLIDPENTSSPVWPDTAYRLRRNEGFLTKYGLVSMIYFRKLPRKGTSDVLIPRAAPRSVTLAKALFSIE